MYLDVKKPIKEIERETLVYMLKKLIEKRYNKQYIMNSVSYLKDNEDPIITAKNMVNDFIKDSIALNICYYRYNHFKTRKDHILIEDAYHELEERNKILFEINKDYKKLIAGLFNLPIVLTVHDIKDALEFSKYEFNKYIKKLSSADAQYYPGYFELAADAGNDMYEDVIDLLDLQEFHHYGKEILSRYKYYKEIHEDIITVKLRNER